MHSYRLRPFRSCPLPLASVVLAVACLPAARCLAQQRPGEQLVWVDEFSAAKGLPDPANWTYETGGGGWGNHELETYCSPKTTDPPCQPFEKPNAFVGGDGYLHLVARRDEKGNWTSARLLTKGLHSFGYGRIEARIRIPSGAGVWPAFWMLGDNIDKHPWPACGEVDIMENVGKLPRQINGSVHGVGFTGTPLTTIYRPPSGTAIANSFHTFGLIWAPGRLQMYMDDPRQPYATYTRADLPAGAIWPFDDGRYFILMNLAVGGDWPGPPGASTAATLEMLVDYVRVYGSDHGDSAATKSDSARAAAQELSAGETPQ